MREKSSKIWTFGLLTTVAVICISKTVARNLPTTRCRSNADSRGPQGHPHPGSSSREGCMDLAERGRWQSELSDWAPSSRDWLLDHVEETLTVHQRNAWLAKLRSLRSEDTRLLSEAIGDLEERDLKELFSRFAADRDYRTWVEQRRAVSTKYTSEHRMDLQRALGDDWDVTTRDWLLDRLGEINRGQRDNFVSRWAALSAQEKTDVAWGFKNLKTNEKKELLSRFYKGNAFVSWLGRSKLELRKKAPFDGDERQKWQAKLSGWNVVARIYFVDQIGMFPGDERDILLDQVEDLSEAEIRRVGERVRNADTTEREALIQLLNEGKDFRFWLKSGMSKPTEREKREIRSWFNGLHGMGEVEINAVLNLLDDWSVSERRDFGVQWKAMNTKAREEFILDFVVGSTTERAALLKAIRSGLTTRSGWRGDRHRPTSAEKLEIRGWFSRFPNLRSADVNDVVDLLGDWSRSERTLFGRRWNAMRQTDKTDFIADLKKTNNQQEREALLEAIRQGLTTSGSWRMGKGKMAIRELREVQGWFRGVDERALETIVAVFNSWSASDRANFKGYWIDMTAAVKEDFLADLQAADSRKRQRMLRHILEGRVTKGGWNGGEGESGSTEKPGSAELVELTERERRELREWFHGVNVRDVETVIGVFETWTSGERLLFRTNWNRITPDDQHAFMDDLLKTDDIEERTALLLAVRGGATARGSWNIGAVRLTQSERAEIQGWFRSLSTADTRVIVDVFDKWHKAERDSFRKHWNKMTYQDKADLIADLKVVTETAKTGMIEAIKDGKITDGGWKKHYVVPLTSSEKLKIRSWFIGLNNDDKDMLIEFFGTLTVSDRKEFEKYWSKMSYTDKRDFIMDLNSAGVSDKKYMIKSIKDGNISSGSWKKNILGHMTSSEKIKVRGWFTGLNEHGKDMIVDLFNSFSKIERELFEKYWNKMNLADKRDFNVDLNSASESDRKDMITSIKEGNISSGSWKKGSEEKLTSGEKVKIRGWFTGFSENDKDFLVDLFGSFSKTDRELFQKYWNIMSYRDKHDFKLDMKSSSKAELNDMLKSITEGNITNGSWKKGNGESLTSSEKIKVRGWFSGLNENDKNLIIDFFGSFSKAERELFEKNWNKMTYTDKRDFNVDLNAASDSAKKDLLESIKAGNISNGSWKKGAEDRLTSSEILKVRGWFNRLSRDETDKLVSLFGSWPRSDRDQFERHWNGMSVRVRIAFMTDLSAASSDDDRARMLAAVRAGATALGGWRGGVGTALTAAQLRQLRGWFGALDADDMDAVVAVYTGWSAAERSAFERHWTALDVRRRLAFVIEFKAADTTEQRAMLAAVQRGDTDSNSVGGELAGRLGRVLRGRNKGTTAGGGGGTTTPGNMGLSAEEKAEFQALMGSIGSVRLEAVFDFLARWPPADRMVLKQEWRRLNASDRERLLRYVQSLEASQLEAIFRQVKQSDPFH